MCISSLAVERNHVPLVFFILARGWGENYPWPIVSVKLVVPVATSSAAREHGKYPPHFENGYTTGPVAGIPV